MWLAKTTNVHSTPHRVDQNFDSEAVSGRVGFVAFLFGNHLGTHALNALESWGYCFTGFVLSSSIIIAEYSRYQHLWLKAVPNFFEETGDFERAPVSPSSSSR